MAKNGNSDIKTEHGGTEQLAESPTKNDLRTNSTVDKTIEAAGIGADPAAGIEPEKRKSVRGTKPAASTKSAGQSKALDLTAQGRKTLATQLVGVHKIAGIMLQMPEVLEITQDQSEAMVLAVTDVMAQYKIKPNPKAVAWANLAGTLAMIYAPKVYLIRAVIKERQKQAKARANGLHPVTSPESEQQVGTMVFN